jgi:hypothetical protein
MESHCFLVLNACSIRNAFDGGQLSIAAHLAESEDFEKTWQLEQFIEKLKERCQTDSFAYKKYRADREYQKLVKACKRHGMLIPAKEDIIHKKITFHGTGPLTFRIDKQERERQTSSP